MMMTTTLMPDAKMCSVFALLHLPIHHRISLQVAHRIGVVVPLRVPHSAVRAAQRDGAAACIEWTTRLPRSQPRGRRRLVDCSRGTLAPTHSFGFRRPPPTSVDKRSSVSVQRADNLLYPIIRTHRAPRPPPGAGLMRRLQQRLDFDSTAVRLLM